MSIPAWAVPGSEVVCVSKWGGHTSWYLPKRGIIYIIDRVDADHQDGPMLELCGIGDAHHGYKFPVNCFRPVIRRSREHDMAIFRPILDQVPVAA